MTFSFEGHTVAVTGAGGGLGKAYALHQVPEDLTDTRRAFRQLLLAVRLKGSECCGE